ncbi:MAG: formyltransferase family protein [Solirubrobacteraceae bacterium]
MVKRPLRLLLFVDPDLESSVSLLAGCLETAAARDDREVIAIVDTARQPPSPLRLPLALAARGVRGISNLNTAAEPNVRPLLTTCASLARRRRVPVLAPRARGVNDPGFVEAVRRLEPDATIALMVEQIFRSPLLAACNVPVNYHNGLLPQYQGVAATSWSIYERAPRSGFSFHLMTEDVDRGPILLQGALPLGPGATAAPIERAKTRLARSELNSLFDLLASPGEKLVGQGEPGSSFSRADLQAIRAVEDPEKLSLDELELRLRAFERIDLTLAGQRYTTTALRRIRRRPRDRRLAFRTVDGIWVEPSRIRHLPPIVYRLPMRWPPKASAG